MFHYHNQLLSPMFLNLLLTSGQVHNYGTRTANNYRSHPCRTNLKQFIVGILSQAIGLLEDTCKQFQ